MRKEKQLFSFVYKQAFKKRKREIAKAFIHGAFFKLVFFKFVLLLTVVK